MATKGRKPQIRLMVTGGPKRWSNQPRLAEIRLSQRGKIVGAKFVGEYTRKNTIRVEDLIPGMSELPIKLKHLTSFVDRFDHPEEDNLSRVDHMAVRLDELVQA